MLGGAFKDLVVNSGRPSIVSLRSIASGQVVQAIDVVRGDIKSPAITVDGLLDTAGTGDRVTPVIGGVGVRHGFELRCRVLVLYGAV